MRSRRSERGGGGAAAAIVIAVALIVVAWLLSIVIRFALSRKREFLADAGSVELTKNPDAMIVALRKIEGRGELPGATSAVMEMCLDNPRQDFSNLFDTHPSIDARVDAIVKFAGGHDPGPLALAEPEQQADEGADGPVQEPVDQSSDSGPWGRPGEIEGSSGEKPFLPSRPPIDLGETPPAEPGPWGRKPGS
jgi:heat shock protein HtpX